MRLFAKRALLEEWRPTVGSLVDSGVFGAYRFFAFINNLRRSKAVVASCIPTLNLKRRMRNPRNKIISAFVIILMGRMSGRVMQEKSCEW